MIEIQRRGRQHPGGDNASISAVALALCAVLAGACGKAADVAGQASAASDLVREAKAGSDAPLQWRLPPQLAEISGLALTLDGRLFAHDDEHAIVYEIDFDNGRLVKRFAFGKRDLSADFEGIAIAADSFYLVTSDGDLYRFAEGADGSVVPARRVRTGAGARCEIEGLEYDPRAHRLLLACKIMYDEEGDASDEAPAILAWDIASARLLEDQTISIRHGPHGTVGDLAPSGLALLPGGERFLVVAARQRTLLEIDRDGMVLVSGPLRLAKSHAQAEGIVVLTDGRVLLADEGRRSGALLSVYPDREAMW